MEKLGLGDARQILAMLKGEEIASSKLSPRLTALLRQEGLLMLKNNGSRCKYRIAEAMREGCRTLLSQEFGLKCSLEEWISASSSMQTRADMVRMVGDSKAKKVNTFRGFLVDCYVQIDAMLHGKPFILHPMEGSSVFINQPDRFEIPEDVIVVGMENAENFMQIRLQRWLFDALFPGRQLLFVCRYPQETWSISGHGFSAFPIITFISAISIWQEFISIFQSFMPIWVIGLPSWCHLISRKDWPKAMPRFTISNMPDSGIWQ